MSPILKQVPFVAVAAGMVCAAWYFLPRAPVAPGTQSHSAAAKPHTRNLSQLAGKPDWSQLDACQGVITRADFENQLATIFTTGDSWRSFVEIDDQEARIKTSDTPEAPVKTIRFAADGPVKNPPRYWKSANQLSPAPDGQPLAGLRIAIDAGHLGGEWARMEGRWLKIGDLPPVMEGEMTLDVAKLLESRLSALGAKVVLVRKTAEPVTRLRPDNLMDQARESLPENPSDEEVRKAAEKLFYRTAEIRARAKLVNEVIRPDLVLCLHFNAEPWGDPEKPVLTDRTHFHLLVNGAYTDDEVAMEDQRAALFAKLLSRSQEEEVAVASTVAEAFLRVSGLPVYSYPAASKSARPIPGQPAVWARNLLANRLYQCPVVFLEPYVMNSSGDHARIQAGDYPGLREIGGKLHRSIFKEYADAVTEGLAIHYRKMRAPSK